MKPFVYLVWFLLLLVSPLATLLEANGAPPDHSASTQNSPTESRPDCDKTPTLIYNNNNVKIYHNYDSSDDEEEAVIILRMRAPKGMGDARLVCANEFIVYYLNDEILEMTASAERMQKVLGDTGRLYVDITRVGFSLNFDVSGKYSLVNKMLLKCLSIMDGELSAKRFARVQKHLINKYAGAYALHARLRRQELLAEWAVWSLITSFGVDMGEMLENVKSMTLYELKSAAKTAREQFEIKGIVHGAIPHEPSLVLCRALDAPARGNVRVDSGVPEPNILLQLRPGEEIVYTDTYVGFINGCWQTYMVDQGRTGVMQILDEFIGNDSYAAKRSGRLPEQVPYRGQKNTKNNFSMIEFYAQSHSTQAEELRGLIEEYVAALKERVASLGEADMAKIKNEVLSRFSQPATFCSVKARRLFEIIWEHDAQWDWREQFAREIAAVSKEDLLKAVDEAFSRKTRRVVTVLMKPNTEMEAGEEIKKWKLERTYK